MKEDKIVVKNIDGKRIDCANDVVSFALQTEKQRKSP